MQKLNIDAERSRHFSQIFCTKTLSLLTLPNNKKLIWLAWLPADALTSSQKITNDTKFYFYNHFIHYISYTEKTAWKCEFLDASCKSIHNLFRSLWLFAHLIFKKSATAQEPAHRTTQLDLVQTWISSFFRLAFCLSYRNALILALQKGSMNICFHYVLSFPIWR